MPDVSPSSGAGEHVYLAASTQTARTDAPHSQKSLVYQKRLEPAWPRVACARTSGVLPNIQESFRYRTAHRKERARRCEDPTSSAPLVSQRETDEKQTRFVVRELGFCRPPDYCHWVDFFARLGGHMSFQTFSNPCGNFLHSTSVLVLIIGFEHRL